MVYSELIIFIVNCMNRNFIQSEFLNILKNYEKRIRPGSSELNVPLEITVSLERVIILTTWCSIACFIHYYKTLASLWIQFQDSIKWICDTKWEFFFDKNGLMKDLLSGWYLFASNFLRCVKLHASNTKKSSESDNKRLHYIWLKFNWTFVDSGFVVHAFYRWT